MMSSPTPSSAPRESLKCFFCDKEETESRKLCHFAATKARPTPLTIHVFCGMTAAILPQVRRPDLEILSVSQVKNRFGLEPRVMHAMNCSPKSSVVTTSTTSTTTRSTTSSNNVKVYYLTQDIETFVKSPQSEDTNDVSALHTSPNPSIVTTKTARRQVTPDTTSEAISGSTVYPDPLALVPSPPTKRSKAATAETSIQSPYATTMEFLFHVCHRENAVAYRIIRGVGLDYNYCASRSSVVDHHHHQQVPPDHHTCSQYQVNAMRIILLTTHREWYVQSMERQLAPVTIEDPTIDDTHYLWASNHFCKRVVAVWKNSVQPAYRQHDDNDNHASIQFDLLLAFTLTIHKNNAWLFQQDDDDCGGNDDGACFLLQELAKTWKVLLGKPLFDLGVDGEFTFPGVVALLDDFRTTVKGVDDMQFDFLPYMLWMPK